MYRTTKKSRLGTWKWIAIISINEARKVKLSNRLELSPRLEFIWNLAILCDFYIICVITDTENVKLLSTAKEATADEPGPNENFIRRISARVINIFMKTVSILNGLISPFVYIGNTKNGYHLSGSQYLFGRRYLIPREKCNVYMILTLINFSWRLWTQIKHVYLIKFTQAVWLLTNWRIAMNKTNLTQHGRSTDVYASDVLYPTDKKNILKKRGNLLRTTSFFSNSCCVRILINIIMVSLRAALTGRHWNMNWKIDERWH